MEKSLRGASIWGEGKERLKNTLSMSGGQSLRQKLCCYGSNVGYRSQKRMFLEINLSVLKIHKSVPWVIHGADFSSTLPRGYHSLKPFQLLCFLKIPALRPCQPSFRWFNYLHRFVNHLTYNTSEPARKRPSSKFSIPPTYKYYFCVPILQKLLTNFAAYAKILGQERSCWLC